MKTYKQLADELGVSKDKIKYRARKIPSAQRPIVDGVTYLSDEAVATITEAIQGARYGVVGKEVTQHEIYLLLQQVLENQGAIMRRLEALEQTQSNHSLPTQRSSFLARLFNSSEK